MAIVLLSLLLSLMLLLLLLMLLLLLLLILIIIMTILSLSVKCTVAVVRPALRYMELTFNKNHPETTDRLTRETGFS